MLLVCTSCNSRYLVNSADFKPEGRTVRCVKCGHEWLQKAELIDKKNQDQDISKLKINEKNKQDIKDSPVSNLPSTYIVNEKPKILNSILIILSLILIFFIFWFFNREEKDFVLLLNWLNAMISFYIQEFTFNLKLIINDIVKLTQQIINL